MDAERIIFLCGQHGDFVTGEDGFVVFWPAEKHGSHNAFSLRTIADELDRRNGPWANHLAEAMSK